MPPPKKEAQAVNGPFIVNSYRLPHFMLKRMPDVCNKHLIQFDNAVLNLIKSAPRYAYKVLTCQIIDGTTISSLTFEFHTSYYTGEQIYKMLMMYHLKTRHGMKQSTFDKDVKPNASNVMNLLFQIPNDGGSKKSSSKLHKQRKKLKQHKQHGGELRATLNDLLKLVGTESVPLKEKNDELSNFILSKNKDLQETFSRYVAAVVSSTENSILTTDSLVKGVKKMNWGTEIPVDHIVEFSNDLHKWVVADAAVVIQVFLDIQINAAYYNMINTLIPEYSTIWVKEVVLRAYYKFLYTEVTMVAVPSLINISDETLLAKSNLVGINISKITPNNALYFPSLTTVNIINKNIIPTKVFKQFYDNHHGMLNGIFEIEGIMIAGGMVLDLMRFRKTNNDVDIFFFQEEETVKTVSIRQSLIKINRVLTVITKNLSETRFEVFVVLSKQALTYNFTYWTQNANGSWICKHTLKIQFICRVFRSPEHVLLNFDLGACCFGLLKQNKEMKLIGTERGLWSNIKLMNIFDPLQQTNYQRINKYQIKGYTTVIPYWNLAEVASYMFMLINRNPFDKKTGIKATVDKTKGFCQLLASWTYRMINSSTYHPRKTPMLYSELQHFKAFSNEREKVEGEGEAFITMRSWKRENDKYKNIYKKLLRADDDPEDPGPWKIVNPDIRNYAEMNYFNFEFPNESNVNVSFPPNSLFGNPLFNIKNGGKQNKSKPSSQRKRIQAKNKI